MHGGHADGRLSGGAGREAPAHAAHRGPMAGRQPRQPRGAAWRDGHPEHLFQQQPLAGVEGPGLVGRLQRHRRGQLHELLREALRGSGGSQVHCVPTAHGPRLDQRPKQEERRQGERRGRHLTLQRHTSAHLPALAFLPAGQAGHEPRHVRRGAPAGRLPGQPEGGRLLQRLPDDRLGHLLEQRLRQEVCRTNQH